MSRGRVCGLAAAAVLAGAAGARAEPTEGASVIFFGGLMTDNVWEETFQPWKLEIIDSQLIGVGVGYEWPLRWPSWSVGLEAQVVQHFGRQDHVEFNLPMIVRYYPSRPIVPALESLAFGIGLSTTTEVPQTEIDRDGESSKTLIYWMGEFEFALPRDDLSIALRLHHRSDAYGVFDTDSGSNAIVIGLKRRF